MPNEASCTKKTAARVSDDRTGLLSNFGSTMECAVAVAIVGLIADAIQALENAKTNARHRPSSHALSLFSHAPPAEQVRSVSVTPEVRPRHSEQDVGTDGPVQAPVRVPLLRFPLLNTSASANPLRSLVGSRSV